jgi:hypothetical protein
MIIEHSLSSSLIGDEPIRGFANVREARANSCVNQIQRVADKMRALTEQRKALSSIQIEPKRRVALIDLERRADAYAHAHHVLKRAATNLGCSASDIAQLDGNFDSARKEFRSCQ